MSIGSDRGALIVDPDALLVAKIGRLVEGFGYSFLGHTHFEEARRQLLSAPPSLLVANVRLAAFNGVHLAYLARSTRPLARMVLYAHPHDRLLARDAQDAGAFYERGEFLMHALPALIGAELPSRDRRGPASVDRRYAFRGGRRTTDSTALPIGGPL